MLKYPSVQTTKGKVAAQETLPGKQPQQRQSSKAKGDVPTTLKTATTTAKLEEGYILKWKEFMCFAFIWETPLFQVVNYIDLIVERGGMMVFLAYFMFSMAVAMPVFALLLFYGSYTKRGYIKLWEMVPILKGMSWSVSIFSIFLEFFNVSIGGLALIYIPNLFNSQVPWSHCNFLEATSACYPMFPEEPYTKTCVLGKDDDIIHFPAYEYFLNNKIHAPALSKDYEHAGKLQVPWVISVCFTWFIIFLLLTLGFQKFRTVINNIAFTFAVIFFIPTFQLTIFKSHEFARPSFMGCDFMTLFDIQFWISILTHSFSRKLPGNYVVLGSRAPASMTSNLNTFCIYGMKYVCFVFLMVWLSTSVQLVQLHYKVKDVNCIHVSGLSLVFAIIPDMFTRFPVPHIPLFLYFFGLWFFGLLSALYTMHAFYESITEAWPGIIGMRVYFCAILCIVSCLLNMTLPTSVYLTVMEVWAEFGFTHITVILSLIFSVGIFIYSVRKYGNDFYFMYGKPLGSFWTHGLKLSLLVSFLCFALSMSNYVDLKLRYPTSTVVYVFCYIFMVVVLAPILVVAVWNYLKYKNQGKAVKAITPTADWGPPSSIAKQIRSRFNPKREIRIKNEVQKCRHNCLLNSQRIKDEIKALQQNRSRLTSSLGMATSDEEL